MEFTVHCCDACPAPRPEDMPPRDELTLTGVEGEYLLDDDLITFAVSLGADEEQSGVLCPIHVTALRWLLQPEEPATV